MATSVYMHAYINGSLALLGVKYRYYSMTREIEGGTNVNFQSKV